MIRRAMAICLLVLGAAGSLAGAPVRAAEPVAVSVVNASRPTRCAEEDNVYVQLLGAGVGRFVIRAQHPPYISLVQTDSTAPDFTACDMSQDPSFPFTPRTVVLHEDADIRLVGHRFPSFWRPDVVDFSVGGRTEPGLHLVQLIRRRAQGEVEVLVVYPADGYWRVKPLPPSSLPDTAYGSSFLFGPIEESSRPFVAIRRIGFDPATLTFRVDFRDGTRGMLAVASATPEQTLLALTIDPPLAQGRPFAALRSMYVSPAQADVSVAAWRAGESAMAIAPILGVGRVNASSVRFGRVEPSRHNLSAPDLVFEEFATSTSR
ncbi:MAG: hypothetical protein IPM01_19855 [Burkholderiaceae bacterium]|nr:hypothetical protein [Burkholderiaceae bacterium]